MTQNNIVIKILAEKDPDLKDYIPASARLRIEVFRNFPYLWDNSMEYQLYVVQSVLLGKSARSDRIDENTGAAGICGPVD